MNWQTVYIFISSTFNDMHAERDHLVKQVFPQLRIWCAQRKLKLVDIDLRWGVSAADAEENKRVVEVCMKNIDKCRPFFLCFMGQRRGWVPESKDINAETLRLFPELSKYIGKASVTELEILHALMHPFSENAIPVEHSRFYFRDKNYLKQIPTEAHKNLFCPKRGFLAKGDSELEQFKKEIAKQYPVVEYSANWNATKPSPELTGELSKGRLENFRTKNSTLSDDIIAWLKKEIALAYPDHIEMPAVSDPLDIELDRQDTQLFLASDGYIPRPHEERALVGLINEQENTPILLLADAGCGKTSLLARIINQNKEHISLYYRFVGTTPDSFRIEDIAASLAKQWVRDGLLSESDIDHPENELALLFPNLITKAGRKKNITIILDGMDQISGGFKASYLPKALPNRSHLIVSMRSDSPNIPTEAVRVHTLGMMSEREDKVQMIKGYLNSFFKDVDDQQLEQIVSMDGSSNPLYLKIVLNELRQHGSFDTLFEMLTKNYGATPIEAFEQMITRVTNQLQQLGIHKNFADTFFGCLSVAQAGINGKMLTRGIRLLDHSGVENLSDTDLNDLFNSLGRELEPFFIFDGDKLSMRYNSMCRAVQNINSHFVTVSHTLNAGIFGIFAMDEDNTEYMKHSLYHLAEAQEQFVYNVFSSPDTILWILKRMGAVPLIRTFRDLGEKRNLAEFAQLAKFLSKAAARLETYPETLFTELERYADTENKIAKQLLAQRDNFEKPHFVPLNQSAQDMLIREYALPQEKLYGFAYSEPYYIVYEDDHLKVIDRRTNEMANILFHNDTGRYGLCCIAAGDDLLYVSYWGMGGLKDGFNYCECYTLPDLSFVSRIDTLDIDYTSAYELFVLEGKLYGYFNHMLGTFGDQEEKRTEQAIVCISTNEILFKEVFTGSGTHHILGEHITLHDHGSGYWQIIRIKDGKVLVKEHFIGEDGQLIKHPLAGSANLYAARVENQLCVYMSGGNVVKDGDKLRLTNEQQTRLYNVLEDGSLETNTKTTVPDELKLSYIHDCSLNYYFGTQKNTVTAFTKNLEPLDGIHISGHPGLIRNFSQAIAETTDGELIVFTDLSVQTYNLEKLIAAASKDGSKISHTKCDGLVRDGSFYVFGPKVEKYDLLTLEKTDSIGAPTIIQFICPWNIQPSHDTCILTAANGKDYSVFYFDPSNFGVKQMGTQTMLYSVDDPVKNTLLHAFAYDDKANRFTIANVVADKQQTTHTFKGRDYTFYRCRLLLLKEIGSTLKFKWFEQELNVEVMGKSPFEAGIKSLICDGKTYLVFPNVYINNEKLGFSVYDVEAESMLYSFEMDSIIGPFYEGNLSFYEQGLAVSYVENGNNVFEQFDAKETRRLRDSNNIKLFDQPIRDDYVYLRKPKEMKILVCSLKEHKTVTSFELTDRTMFNVQQILTVDNLILVRNLMSDILEVYDFESGEKLFDQRMEQPLEDLFYDSKTNRLISLDTNRNVCIWEIKK